MSNFKIEIGNWVEFWADGSLDLPSDIRQAQGWAATVSGTGTAGVVVSTNTKAASGYVLGILSGSGETLYYSHAAGTAPFTQSANNAQGYTIEANLKVLTSITVGHRISFADDKWSEYLSLNTAYIQLGQAGTTYTMDTTDDFHKYRITAKGTEVKVYVDDTLRVTETLANAASTLNAPYLRFGDFIVTQGGEVRYAYVRYNTEGAFAPQEDWYIDRISLTDKRSTRAQAIIRSNNSIIKEGNMGPAKIKLTGTIAGSCYDSFRDTVRRLKKLLIAGHQRVYIDDERYIMGLHKSFVLQPITTDYAKFSIGFDCRQPFYQNLWGEYFSTVPVANATFYIINESDVEVPVKVIFTGTASTTIPNAVRLKNVTAEQDAKYTGILEATQEFISDKGFDDYNSYAVLASSNGTSAYNSSFGSYEGDLFTLKPGQNNFVYIGTAAGTLEFYWRGSFLQ